MCFVGRRRQITDSTVSGDDFVTSYPGITFTNESLAVIETVTRVTQGLRSEFVAASMLESKMKSADVISSQSTFTTEVSCKMVNQAAFEWAWSELASDVAKERFLRRNITWSFLDDVIYDSENDWLASELYFNFNGNNSSLSIF